jgi:hypothetical protein
MKVTRGKNENRAGGPRDVRLLAAHRIIGIAPALVTPAA